MFEPPAEFKTLIGFSQWWSVMTQIAKSSHWLWWLWWPGQNNRHWPWPLLVFEVMSFRCPITVFSAKWRWSYQRLLVYLHICTSIDLNYPTKPSWTHFEQSNSFHHTDNAKSKSNRKPRLVERIFQRPSEIGHQSCRCIFNWKTEGDVLATSWYRHCCSHRRG